MKKNTPGQAEVTAEIWQLRGLAPRVREISAFGENNRDAIDAQVEVLEKDLDEDEIYEQFGEDSEDFAQNVLDAALDARHWLDGDEDVPSEGWKPLAQ